MNLDVHLSAIAAGDADAFGRWMAGAERPLRESLRSFARRVDVEAVLQETLLRVWNVAPRVERDERPNALLRLAIRAARNLAIDEIRRVASAPWDDSLGKDEEATAITVEPDPLLRAAIKACHDGLPDRPKRALAARIESGGTHHDTALAVRLGMSLNTFLQNFTRARKLLAACLRARGVDLGELA